MRDDPPKKQDPRVQEWVTTSTDAKAVAIELKSLQPERFFLCAIHTDLDSQDSVKEQFKAYGFRAMRKEPLMVKNLGQDLPFAGSFQTRRILELEDAMKINNTAGSKQILLPELAEANPKLRLYAAWDGDRPVGWVRSIRTHPDRTWVSNMYVDRNYRRQGVGSQVMRTMLMDDHELGAKWSVLLASTDGSKLYESLGYRQIAILQLFSPIKEIWGLV